MASAPITAESIDVEPHDCEFSDVVIDIIAVLLIDALEPTGAAS